MVGGGAGSGGRQQVVGMGNVTRAFMTFNESQFRIRFWVPYVGQNPIWPPELTYKSLSQLPNY